MLTVIAAVWLFAIPLVLVIVYALGEALYRRAHRPLECMWRARSRVPEHERVGVLSTSGRQRQRHHGRREA